MSAETIASFLPLSILLGVVVSIASAGALALNSTYRSRREYNRTISKLERSTSHLGFNISSTQAILSQSKRINSDERVQAIFGDVEDVIRSMNDETKNLSNALDRYKRRVGTKVSVDDARRVADLRLKLSEKEQSLQKLIADIHRQAGETRPIQGAN